MSTPDPESKAAAPLWPKLIVALVLLAATGVALRKRIARWLHPPPPLVAAPRHPDSETAPPSPAVLAFLAPIAVGTRLDGADVTAIHGLYRGLIRVDFRKDNQPLSFTIGLANPARAALRAGPYAVYVWESRAPMDVTAALTDAIVRSLRAHLDRPAPPGLSVGVFPPTDAAVPVQHNPPPTTAVLPTPTATIGPPHADAGANPPPADR